MGCANFNRSRQAWPRGHPARRAQGGHRSEPRSRQRPWPWWARAVLLFGWSLWLGTGTPRPTLGAEPAVPAEAPLPTLTNAIDVLELPPAEAAKGFPVRLQAVVTCFEQRSSLFFVQDATAGIYVYDYHAEAMPKVGQRVEVVGRSAQGNFSPYVGQAVIRSLGAGELPAARLVSLEQLAYGSLDAQRVSVEGVVRSARQDWGHLLLEIASGTGRLKLRVLEYRADLETNLVAARIKAAGVVGTHYNTRRQLTGFHLFVPRADDLEVIDTALRDPFSTPVQLSSTLLNYTPARFAGRRARIQGIVTLHWPGRALFVSDESGGCRVEPTVATPLGPGDRVDVVGFPARDGYTPVLEDAIVRRTGSGPVPAAARLTVEQVLSGAFDKQLIELEAGLVGEETGAGGQPVLLLQAAGKVFPARLPPLLQSGPADPPATGRASPLIRRPAPFVGWLPDSRVRVRGVCVAQLDERLQPSAFELWLPSADDATLLARPAGWWKPRLARGAVALLGVGLFGAAWAAILRWQVRRRTAELQQREDAVERRRRELEAEHQRAEAALRQYEQRLRQTITERERLGRDLHDNIIQSIYAVGLGLEDTRHRLRDDPAAAEKQLANAVHGLNQVIRDVRSFIAGLQPTPPKPLDLAEAFKTLLWTIGYDPRCRFEFKVESHAAEQLEEAQLSSLLQIAREAMSNSLRHARARTVQVALQPNHDALHFEVRDDGVGFDAAAVGASGFGLRNISARAQELGARLEVHSRPGQGTRIVLKLPLDHDSTADPDHNHPPAAGR